MIAWLLALLLLLGLAVPAQALDTGGPIFRNTCTQITAPVTNRVLCWEQTTQILKFWDGSAWFPITAQGIRVSPKDYGAKCDGNTTTFTGTDDSAAFEAMMVFVRTQVTNSTFGDPNFYTVAIHFPPGVVCRLASTWNLTGLRTQGFGLQIFGNGATIYSTNLNNVPMVDAIYSSGLHIHDLTLYAENGPTAGTGNIRPSYGLVWGRKAAEDASGNACLNCRITGWFNRSTSLNIGGEIAVWTKPFLLNSMDDSGGAFSGLAMHLDPANVSGYTSQFQTMGTPSAFGMNEHLVVQGRIASAQAAAVRVDGITAGFKMVNTYITAPSGKPAVRLFGSHRDMDLDIHVEVTGVTYNVLIDLTAASTLWNFKLTDHQTQADYLIGTVNRVAAGAIINGEIRAGSALNDATRIFEPSSTLAFQGALHIGTTQAGLNNLSGASAIRGEIYTAASAATIQANLPATGFARIRSTAEAGVVDHGLVGFGGANDAIYGRAQLIGAGYQALVARSTAASGVVNVLAANQNVSARIGAISNHPVEVMVNNAAVFTFTSAGAMRPTPFLFANIATVLAANGDLGYCSDCTIANPCAGGGTGALAKRLNGVQVCN